MNLTTSRKKHKESDQEDQTSGVLRFLSMPTSFPSPLLHFPGPDPHLVPGNRTINYHPSAGELELPLPKRPLRGQGPSLSVAVSAAIKSFEPVIPMQTMRFGTTSRRFLDKLIQVHLQLVVGDIPAQPMIVHNQRYPHVVGCC